jgi:hypothetical protein
VGCGTFPLARKAGPPELPGLIAASIYRTQLGVSSGWALTPVQMNTVYLTVPVDTIGLVACVICQCLCCTVADDTPTHLYNRPVSAQRSTAGQGHARSCMQGLPRTCITRILPGLCVPVYPSLTQPPIAEAQSTADRRAAAPAIRCRTSLSQL